MREPWLGEALAAHSSLFGQPRAILHLEGPNVSFDERVLPAAQAVLLRP